MYRPHTPHWQLAAGKAVHIELIAPGRLTGIQNTLTVNLTPKLNWIPSWDAISIPALTVTRQNDVGIRMTEQGEFSERGSWLSSKMYK